MIILHYLASYDKKTEIYVDDCFTPNPFDINFEWMKQRYVPYKGDPLFYDCYEVSETIAKELSQQFNMTIHTDEYDYMIESYTIKYELFLKYKGKLFSISIDNRRQVITGIPMSMSEEWLQIQSMSDKHLTEYIIINRKHISKIEVDQTEVLLEHIFEEKSCFSAYPNIPLNTVELFNYLDLLQISCRMELYKSDVTIEGKIGELFSNTFLFKLKKDTRRKEKTLIVREASVRVIRLYAREKQRKLNDYIRRFPRD
ncbi:MAG: hypothetical protein LBM62_05040 [Mediterranea sp.]|jgi:hypothetical protein|nr:hypothetical protein [Mediterranea sp.]